MIYHLCRILFPVVHALAWPWRLLGGAGTAENPREYVQGDDVPEWLYRRYPSELKVRFLADCDVGFDQETGGCRIWPQGVDRGDAVIAVDGKVSRGLLVGAPTCIDYGPNKRKRRRRVTRVEEALA